MRCTRCDKKGIRTHVLKVKYESGNGWETDLCSDCVRDVERFLNTKPRYNGFGYNLDFDKNIEELKRVNDELKSVIEMLKEEGDLE